MNEENEKERNQVVWYLTVPKELDDKVKKAIRKGMYMTKVELIRDAVRRLLEEL